MTWKVKTVAFLFTTVTFFVVACGNNPEKTRIFLDSSNSLKSEFSDKPYISASNRQFKVNPESLDMEFSGASRDYRLDLQYNPKKKVLEVDFEGHSYDDFKLEQLKAHDKFKILEDIWVKLKADNPGASDFTLLNKSPFSRPDSFKVTCHENRKGQITKMIKRPEDMKIKYGDFNTLSTFNQNPDAKMVIHISVDGNQGDVSFDHDMKEDHIYASYLNQELINDYVLEKCAQSNKSNDIFNNFFPQTFSNNYGSEQSNFALPVSHLDKNQFKLSGFGNSSARDRMDNSLFSVEAMKVSLDYLSSMFNKPLQSGNYFGAYDETTGEYKNKKVFDESEVEVFIDLKSKKLNLTNTKSQDRCQYEISAEILDSFYSTRREHQFNNAGLIEAKLTSVKLHTDTCNVSLQDLEKDNEVLLYVAGGQGEDRLLIQLLDKQRKTKLLSDLSLIIQ